MSPSESLEGAAQLIVSLDHNGEDELVIQTRSFIETILLIFSTHGVFNTLCKVGLFFVIRLVDVDGPPFVA
jgi:hypothetical protein